MGRIDEECSLLDHSSFRPVYNKALLGQDVHMGSHADHSTCATGQGG